MLWSCKTQIVYLLPEPWSSEKDEKFFEGKDMKYEKTSKVPVICANFLTPNQSRKIRLRKFDPIQVGEEPRFLREKEKTKNETNLMAWFHIRITRLATYKSEKLNQ